MSHLILIQEFPVLYPTQKENDTAIKEYNEPEGMQDLEKIPVGEFSGLAECSVLLALFRNRNLPRLSFCPDYHRVL